MNNSLTLRLSLRIKDVGKPKVDTAAEFINKRIPGVEVIPYVDYLL